MLHHAKNLFYRLKGSGDPYHASSLVFIIKCAFAHYISQIVSGAYLARLTSALGFSDSLTGLLSSFVALCGTFQLLSLFMSRKSNSVKWKVIFGIEVSYILFTFMYIVPLFEMDVLTKRLLFCVGFIVAYILQSVITPFQTNWQMSLVQDNRRGAYTAANEMFSLLTGMIFTYAFSSWIDKYEAAGNTRGALILGVVAMGILTVAHAIALIFIREKPSAPVAEDATEKRPAGNGQFAFLKNKMMWKIIGVISLYYVATYSATPFYGSYQIHELGFSMTFVSILAILYGVFRSAVSPFFGRYADKHSFGRSTFICMIISSVGYLLNCFTVPENGMVMYTAYYITESIAAAGISSALTNLVFDYLPQEIRRQALAMVAAVCGLVGFLTTCVMSPVVDWIQTNGNQVFGIHMYAGQFVSVVALAVTLATVFCLWRVFIKGNPPRIQDKAE